MAWGQILGAGLAVGGAMLQKSARKKQIRAMAKKAAETRERFEQKASDARSSFRGSLRGIEALKSSSGVEFGQARANAARLQKSALENRQIARRGAVTPEQQAQLLGMGNMQEYLAERSGRMESIQKLTQMEASIVSQQQQISSDIIKTGAGAEAVWNEQRAKLIAQPDEMGAAIAGAGSAMMSMKPGAAAAAPDVNAGATAMPTLPAGVPTSQNSLTADGTNLMSMPFMGENIGPGNMVPDRIPGWELNR